MWQCHLGGKVLEWCISSCPTCGPTHLALGWTIAMTRGILASLTRKMQRTTLTSHMHSTLLKKWWHNKMLKPILSKWKWNLGVWRHKIKNSNQSNWMPFQRFCMLRLQTSIQLDWQDLAHLSCPFSLPVPLLLGWGIGWQWCFYLLWTLFGLVG